jgi:hypothetical protein
MAFQTLFLEAQNSHVCRISERTQDFIGEALFPLKYDVIMDEVNVYSNSTDSLLFDVVFDAYNWSCGENLMIEKPPSAPLTVNEIEVTPAGTTQLCWLPE